VRSPRIEQRPRIRVGSGAFWRANLALFVGGLVTFAALYATQPLLPTFADEFQVAPATASLSLSVTSATLAVALVLASTLSETLGRKPMMTVSLLATSMLTIATAFAPNFAALLVLRGLQGVALAGLPAVAMAYLGEEIQAGGLGLAVGLYIGGNSIGGMSGRIATGLLADAFGWRVAIASVGALSLACSVLFWAALPASAHFRPRPLGLRQPRRFVEPLWTHLCDTALLRLYVVGFLLQAGFTPLYNYLSFDLQAPPYQLSQAAVGWIFLTYLFGTLGSTAMGRLADRVGRRKVVWLGIGIMAAGALITLVPNLVIKVVGVAVFTFGFFAAHAVASGWVARRAVENRAQASALYLLLYYLGASVGGAAGGLFWGAAGWPGVVGMILAVLGLALLLVTVAHDVRPEAAAAHAGSLQPRSQPR
jgi:YNFM family putative membrane transporter